jgi:hypothetical protein
MWRKTRKKFVSVILTSLLASGMAIVALAQTNALPIGPDEIEVQVRQQWKDSETTCEISNQAKIDHVDIINSYEFKNWLLNRHSIYGNSLELFPRGNYIRVASSAENIGDGITVFGPVYTGLKIADFSRIVGLPICNYNVKKPAATQLKVDE